MATRPRKRIKISVLIPFLVFILFFTVMIWQKYRSSQEMPVATAPQNVKGYRDITLFFSADGTRLAREARVIDPCDDATACIKNVLHELLNGPIGGFEATLPGGTIVEAVHVEGDLATIELNRTFSDAMLSGSSAEMLAVYSLVDTVTVNFPQIQKVKINVDGNAEAVLHHLDLSEPLEPDYTLEAAPSSEPEHSSTGMINKHKGGAR